jgi:hypothetical protein
MIDARNEIVDTQGQQDDGSDNRAIKEGSLVHRWNDPFSKSCIALLLTEDDTTMSGGTPAWWL